MYRYFLALRYLLSRPINLIGMAGVLVGVWALIVVVSIFSGFLKEVRVHIHAAASDISVISKSGPISYARLSEIIMRDSNVEACAPRVVWYGLLHAFNKTHETVPEVRALDSAGAASPLVFLVGIDPDAEARVTGLSRWIDDVPADLRVDDPRNPLALQSDAEKDPVILLSQDRLNREFVGKGATAKITSARLNRNTQQIQQQLTFLDQVFRIAGAYATKHHKFDAQNCFVHIDYLRGMMSTHARDPVTEVVVKCVDPAKNAETAERLRQAMWDELGGEHSLISRTWQTANEPILSAVDHQRSLMKLVLFVIMVVAALLMFATLSMMVTEKTHDIGILTAMGATRRGIMQVFMSCGLAIVLCGSILGTVVGCFSAIYLDDFNKWLKATFNVDLFPARIYNLDRVPYDLDPTWILQVVGMALALGLLVSGLPAWRAARHDPLESLRNE